MKIPTIRGIIDRRVLVNYRVDPDVLAAQLPAPFRPQLVNGFGVAGICLIRLKQIRPNFLPRIFGVSSENAAHRIAVQWEDDETTQTGVFIPRRDTSSWLNAMTGGRIFPGVHHRANFQVNETDQRLCIEMHSLDDSAHVNVDAVVSSAIPDGSLFNSIAQASQFFQQGSLGYSPRPNGQFDGLELEVFDWQVQPLSVHRVESSYFDDQTAFPAGSVAFDNALLMRGIHHLWHGRERLCCA